jgi:hypothetical protein
LKIFVDFASATSSAGGQPCRAVNRRRDGGRLWSEFRAQADQDKQEDAPFGNAAKVDRARPFRAMPDTSLAIREIVLTSRIQAAGGSSAISA